VRIRVGGALWCQDHANGSVAKPFSNGAAPFPVPIAAQRTVRSARRHPPPSRGARSGS
jgi:hypothetical protein